jgi:hypothetical protein
MVGGPSFGTAALVLALYPINPGSLHSHMIGWCRLASRAVRQYVGSVLHSCRYATYKLVNICLTMPPQNG